MRKPLTGLPQRNIKVTRLPPKRFGRKWEMCTLCQVFRRRNSPEDRHGVDSGSSGMGVYVSQNPLAHFYWLSDSQPI